MFVHPMVIWSSQTRSVVAVILTSMGLVAVLCRAWVVTIDAYYEDRVAPNVSYGHLQLGNLTQAEALAKIEDWQAVWWDQDLRYSAVDEDGRVLTTVEFQPFILAEDNVQSNELVWYDTQGMLAQAMQAAKPEHRLLRAWAVTHAFFQPTNLTPLVEVDASALKSVLQSKLSGHETEPNDAMFEWYSAYQTPRLISEQMGNTFDYEQALIATANQLKRMRNDTIEVRRVKRIPAVNSAQARDALGQLEYVKSAFPLAWTYTDEETDEKETWQWQWTDVYRAVQPVHHPLTGDIRLQLDENLLAAQWQVMEWRLNIDPVDARFEITEDNRVQQFQPSQAGSKLNRAQSLARLNEQILASQPWNNNREIVLAVDVVEPQFATREVNDLGITEVLGVGYSNFRGSPNNRVHNIGVGVRKLHGLLIAPGEEFSLLKALRPFTIAGGYLPELVIKGDKIEPEIGGGLCQIGSTTFRAAMNSGLKITERRNHSLVVSYYNDPRNGNPGTDATIYDSSPDFKFINDTGHHVLIMTSMNAVTGDLVFTLWGTNDGRQASYTEPVVSRWIPAGEKRLIPSDDLKPGEERCQSAHVGAVASFVYTVVRPNGEKEETTYVSNYRPLPQICLVGKEEPVPVDPTFVDPTATDPEVDPLAAGDNYSL